ncbi:hypothetical protein Gpo141_00006754 [Globisporangium polare]
MLRTTTLATALRRHHHRSSTLLVKTANAWSARWLSSSSDSDSAASTAPSSAQESVLPTHIKFRMPDLDFEHISGGNAVVTLSKWHIGEGDEVKDGAQMCEIDTPDLNFVLESGDEGYIAKIFVQEGASNVSPNQPLAVIVPEEDDIQPFLDALKSNPRAIEGYVEPITAELTSSESSSSSSTSSSSSSSSTGSDVLRVLQKLQKEGRFSDEKQLKVLKSLARKNDEQLLVTFKGSFENDDGSDEATFDKEFFVENALELADEAIAKDAEN